MSLGMDMMIKSVLNAAGFDIEDVKKQFSEGYAHYTATVKHFADALSAIQARNARIEMKLNLLLMKNGIDPATLDAQQDSLTPNDNLATIKELGHG
jgi:hypothetical protein